MNLRNYRQTDTESLANVYRNAARPFFERHGYRVVEEERPVRCGVEFLRFKMEKALGRR